MNSQAIILVVDDEPVIRDCVADVLGLSGFKVITAGSGAEALTLMDHHTPDLIIADVMMPQMNGYQLYQRVRRNPDWLLIPFIFLTAKSEKEDVRYGKELGADDYLTKPLEPEDLLAAVIGRLTRFEQFEKHLHSAPHRKPAGQYKIGSLVIDFSRRTVTVLGKEVQLSAKEFDIIQQLVLADTSVVPYDELLGDQDNQSASDEDTAERLRYHIRNIRQKLSAGGMDDDIIVNVRNVGYRLVAAPPDKLGSN